jgi:transposase
MGQRAQILAQIFGFDGWIVKEAFFEATDGRRVQPVGGYAMLRGTRIVLVVARRWLARCSQCARPSRVSHERLSTRRWADLIWAGHPVVLEYAPVRVKCRSCKATPVEMVAWADSYQRQTRRLQHHLALQAASMPVHHVAVLHDVSWATVRRAEQRALERWDRGRPQATLRQVGVDEKYLGRRSRVGRRFVTIVSNLETGEPVWIGYGRGKTTLRQWLDALSPAEKRNIELFAMDLARAFRSAVRETPGLEHAVISHDPFHLTKLAVTALDELRKEVFFRAGSELRRLGGGHGRRWLLLRAWERNDEAQRAEIRRLLNFNATLARGYQLKEEMRAVLRAPDRASMGRGLAHILRRTQLRACRPLRRLHDVVRAHMPEILALAEHRPPTGRIEALNNNWEALVRRARGYRDHAYLLLKLKFITANPVRSEAGAKRFLALAEVA